MWYTSPCDVSVFLRCICLLFLLLKQVFPYWTIPVFDCGIFIESIQTMEQGFLQSGVSAVKTLRIVQAIGIQGISVWGIFRIILFCDFHMPRKVYPQSEWPCFPFCNPFLFLQHFFHEGPVQQRISIFPVMFDMAAILRCVLLQFFRSYTIVFPIEKQHFPACYDNGLSVRFML